MSASTAINPKGARILPPGGGPAAWLNSYLFSSVGQKVIVALTGLGLVGFAVGHMIGNLKLFPGGPEAQGHINAYAEFLKYDLGVLIWIARAGLLTIFVLHLYMALTLQLKARSARPIGYAYQRSAQATTASKTMALTGIVVGVFIVFHLLHFTFAAVHMVEVPGGGQVSYAELRDADGRHDVYNMVVAGFSTTWISILYLIAQLMLFVHLSHGIQSSFHTLGLYGKRFAAMAKLLGYSIAGLIFIGNIAIVIAVWTGYIGPVAPAAQ